MASSTTVSEAPVVQSKVEAETEARPSPPHPYLSGLHRPMAEELTLTDLPVTGVIPKALDGRYLRIGPNPIAPDPAGYHWFIGDGMVHGLRLQGGRALWYRNRWIRSTAVAQAMGVSPAPGPRHGLFDTVNTNVVDIAGRAFALVEAGSYPVELSQDLGEQAYNPFDGGLTGSFTAHPHRDPLTGEWHAICYEALDWTTVRHVAIDRQGRVIREEPITVQHGPSIHDSAITDRFVVILDLPVTFSMEAVMAGQKFPYRWNPDHSARVGLLPRQGTDADVIWCEVEPSYVFHVANAYDLPDGQAAVDVCAFDTMFDGDADGPDAPSRGLERWTIDPVARKVAIRTLDPSPQEFPRCDERRFGQPYRYVYSLAVPDTVADMFQPSKGLYRHDLELGTRELHRFGPDCHPGEFAFAPASPSGPEDEGWLMGLVIDAVADTTDLVILDAQNFTGEPVARVHLPHRAPPGFHGNWIASA